MASTQKTTTIRPGPGGDWAFSIAVTLVALAPRLFVALAWAKEPVWDGHYYHFGATRIAAGLGYSEDVIIDGLSVWKPWCHYPVGYSGLLGFVYKIFGAGLVVAPVVNAVIGALLALSTHRLARYAITEGRARIASALVALHPGLIAYTAVLMTEPLAALGLTVAALAAARFRRQGVGITVSGIVIGLSTLVRPTSLLAAPLLAFTWRGAKRALLGGAGACLVAIVTVLPWTVRNCQVMDGCAFVSTNGGWNLAIGALTETGRFRTLRADDGCPVVTGQVQQDRCWARVGLRTIADRPAQWLALAPKKVAQTFDHESFAIEYLREADPSTWNEARRVAGRNLLSTAHRLLMLLATLSMLAIPRRSDPTPVWLSQLGGLFAVVLAALVATVNDDHPFFVLPLMLVVLAVLPLPGKPRLGGIQAYLVGTLAAAIVTHVIFFGDDRYHLVVVPALCVLAAGCFRRTPATLSSEPPDAEAGRDEAEPWEGARGFEM